MIGPKYFIEKRFDPPSFKFQLQFLDSQISYNVARGFIGGTVSNFKFTQKYFLVGLMTEIVVYTAYPNLYLWLHHRITQKLKQKSKTTFITW